MSNFTKKISIAGTIGVLLYFGIAVYVESLVKKCGGPNELLCGVKRLLVAPGILLVGSPEYPEIWYTIVAVHAILVYYIIKFVARKISR